MRLKTCTAILLPRTTIARDLFILQRKFVVVSNFFTSSYMPFCIDENFFLAFNTYNLGVAVWLQNTINSNYFLLEKYYNWAQNQEINSLLADATICKIWCSYLTRMVYKSCNPTTFCGINLHNSERTHSNNLPAPTVHSKQHGRKQACTQ